MQQVHAALSVCISPASVLTVKQMPRVYRVTNEIYHFPHDIKAQNKKNTY